MDRHRFLAGGLALAALFWGTNLNAQNSNGCKANGSGGANCPPTQMRSTTQAQRKAARAHQAPQKRGVARVYAGVNPATRTLSTLATGVSTLATMAAPMSTPDYFGSANWANSPLPAINPATGAITGGVHKFVNTLPGLCDVSPWGSAGRNELGQCIPIATSDNATFPGSDFYRIGLRDFNVRMHSDLPLAGTKIRGYVELNPDNTPKAQQYLGPLILATRDRPVRVLFENQLTPNGKMFIPMDTTYMGAGSINDGKATGNASSQRAVIHLHGGATPWISDGTPHQWVTPPRETVPNKVGFAKGWSFQNVPDMPGALKFTPALTDGQGTLYWTNAQSGRLMFYHDHSYGTTRLNVYAGEAAGYLLVDPAQETALKTASVPGTIITDPTTGAINSADLAHVIPLVIQDKTFVPDSGEPGGQLAATDPTWDVTNLGGAGSLWFPHVYMPNQNPYDSGASAYGRWDYGPWFWPPQNPAGLASPPVSCTSSAYPGQTLTCPGTPNPSGTPEAFMDTPVINGTAYPKLTVDPAAYRFQVLNAGNDRALNLGLYVADPLSVAVTNGGAGYSAPPTVSFAGGAGPSDATAVAAVSTGSVVDVMVSTGGAGYTLPPVVSFTGGGGTGAAAIATLTNDVVTGIVVTKGGSGYTSTPAVVLTNASGDTTGAGATATAAITPAGAIVSVIVTNPGSAPWTLAPTVVFTNAAGDTTGAGATAIASANTEVKMLDAVPHTSGSPLPLCGTQTTVGGGGLARAAVNNGIPLNGTGLPGGCWPTTWPTDGRDGGVPDPATAGPPIVQIGSEGGLMPSVAVIPSTPMGYEYNRRSITVLNVFSHGLFLGPAERADIVVDFSAFAGKTLILYNDGPAPVPAFDSRIDYYTGDLDQTDTGGAPSTLPGYGPNTRTLMQIQVAQNAAASSSFNLASLQAALPGIFAATQEKVIVPESAYPAANGGGPDTYVRIQDTSLTGYLGGPIGGVTLTSGGAGYKAPITVSITGGGGTGATATATLAPIGVAALTLVNGGSNYSSAPTVTISGGGGSGATATATLAGRSVASIAVGNGGTNYTSAPTVTVAAPACVAGPGCVQATATATVRTTGQRNVTAITVVNVGAGYTSVPAVTITGGGGSGATATATVSRAAVASLTVTNPGTGYASAPTVTFSGGAGSGATATATLAPAVIASITLTNGGSGYTSAPVVSITAGAGAGATAVAIPPTMPILPKTIQELFTLDYGRMNATLGVEVPFTNFLTQTTIPYGYVDPPTEVFKDGETQIWKITHNGVDTHFIHFHLFTVQVINRVGWDGAIKPPDANEMSLKDTVRMNPLEDVIVAVRPIKPPVPWELPNSVRPLDVTQPAGYTSTMSFTNVDPTNQPAAVVNDLTNFGHEYVWHCHILGHEENDMMRAMSLVLSPPPVAGVAATAVKNGNRDTVTLTWADNSVIETGYTVLRASSASGPWTTIGTVVSTTGPTTGTKVTFADTTASRGTTYYYRVITNNMVGYTRAYAAPAAGYPHVSADSAPVTTAAVTTP